MFKQTRKKIVASIMSILILIFLGTLAVIYLSSYFELYQKNQSMLKRYIHEYFINGNPNLQNAPEEKEEGISEIENEFQIATFYSVSFSKEDDSISIDNNGSRVYTDNYLVHLSKKLLEQKEKKGTEKNFVYRIDENEQYTLVVFMDNTLLESSITTLFRYTLFFSGIIIIIFFFLSLYLAKKIVAPLEESYRKQKQFISDAGHELKTPISVISANAEILSREIGENKWLSNIQFENTRMSKLVHQLLTLAKTESNLNPKIISVDVSRLVTGGTLPFEGVAFEKGVVILCCVEEEIFVKGNQEQLEQLMSILLDNAIQHSIVGSKIRVEGRKERGSMVLSVSNEGEEIPNDQKEQIFERFYRRDVARNGEEKRYGLGLAIAKAIVTSHRGKIFVDCQNGVTTFFVVLPLDHKKR